MRSILITTGIFPPDIGGPASYGSTIAEGLAKDFKVTVVTYSRPWSVKSDKAKPYKIVRVWRHWPWLMRHFIYALTVFFYTARHDLTLALNAINSGPSALAASRFFRKSYVARIAGDRSWEAAVEKGRTNLLMNDFQKNKRKGWDALIHWFQVWTCKNAFRIIVPSQYLAGVVKNWGVSESKIKVVYNGVDIKPSDLSKEEARKKLGITGNILLSIGRLEPWKGFRMLIKIIPKIQEINHFFTLVIVGGGSDRKNLEMMIKNLGLERKVFLAGSKPRSELPDYFAAADLFILNSGYEGFSHQILEAMACGVPVISTSVGGNPEVIHQGENGFMIKYNDEFNLIEAIKTLWSMPELRDKFITTGLETSTHFSSDQMIKATKSAIGL